MSGNNAAVTIGADPEFFFRDSRSGSVVPAVGLLGGTKDAPIPIPELPVTGTGRSRKAGIKFGKGYSMQEDNVMAEFNIPPCSDSVSFAKAIVNARRGVEEHVKSQVPYLEPTRECSRLFPDFMLVSKKAKEFGCSPDFDSYENGEPWKKISPKDLKDQGGEWRFAGGHVHIGYAAKIPPFVVANLADVFIGLNFITADNQGMRRKLYGQPGRYRPTTFGIEYRTLSNFWIWDENMAHSVAKAALNLGNALNSGNLMKLQTQYQEIPWADVRKAILEEDYRLGMRVMGYITETVGLGVYL